MQPREHLVAKDYWNSKNTRQSKLSPKPSVFSFPPSHTHIYSSICQFHSHSEIISCVWQLLHSYRLFTHRFCSLNQNTTPAADDARVAKQLNQCLVGWTLFKDVVLKNKITWSQSLLDKWGANHGGGEGTWRGQELLIETEQQCHPLAVNNCCFFSEVKRKVWSIMLRIMGGLSPSVLCWRWLWLHACLPVPNMLHCGHQHVENGRVVSILR